MKPSKSKKDKTPRRGSSNIPRQVRMPPELDAWLEQEAAASALQRSVADKIREIVAEAKQRQQQEQAA